MHKGGCSAVWLQDMAGSSAADVSSAATHMLVAFLTVLCCCYETGGLPVCCTMLVAMPCLSCYIVSYGSLLTCGAAAVPQCGAVVVATGLLWPVSGSLDFLWAGHSVEGAKSAAAREAP